MNSGEPKKKVPSIVRDREGESLPDEVYITVDVSWAYSDIHRCYVFIYLVMRARDGKMKVWYVKEG